MKTIYFWKYGCPYCEKMTQVLANIGFKPTQVLSSDEASDTYKSKYKINMYPTIVFLGKNDSLIGKIEGYQPEDNVRSLITTYTFSNNIRK